MRSNDEPVPKRPRPVLRVGFAGNKSLPTDVGQLSATLLEVFQILGKRLCEISPGVKTINAKIPERKICEFYSQEQPLLRLVTGLCEGADELAAQTFLNLTQTPPLAGALGTCLAAVIPFSPEVYYESRPVEYRDSFIQLAKKCEYIISLDGIYLKPDPPTEHADRCRNRAYRAQSKHLLRAVDLLVATADTSAKGKPGGTIETIREAMQFDMPVVFIHSVNGTVRIIEPTEDPGIALSELNEETPDWQQRIRDLVTRILTREVEDVVNRESDRLSGQELLNEYFDAWDVPPSRRESASRPEERLPARAKLKKQIGRIYELLWPLRDRKWSKKVGLFRPNIQFRSDNPLNPYNGWRARAQELNYLYSDMYRGTFLYNYRLAWYAVLFATLSLVVLGPLHTSIGEWLGRAFSSEQGTQPEGTHDHWGPAILLPLGLVKFAIVFLIYIFTREAKKGFWNDRAVDYRYLAERLRSMYYLPILGSFRAPSATPPQLASRAVRQSAIDWLFDAIVRATPPNSVTFKGKDQGTEFEWKLIDLKSCTLGSTVVSLPVGRIQPERALRIVQDSWILQQAHYHDRTSREMSRLKEYLDAWVKTLNSAVALIVLVDIWITWRELQEHATGDKATVAATIFTSLLVGFATVIPAIVAGLNGTLSQGECKRIAERSAVMRTILRGRDPESMHSGQNWFIHLLNETKKHFLILFRSRRAFADKQVNLRPRPDSGKWAEAQHILEKIQKDTSSPQPLGSWTPQVLHYTEAAAATFVQETAEWSVLYAKEMPDV